MYNAVVSPCNKEVLMKEGCRKYWKRALALLLALLLGLEG